MLAEIAHGSQESRFTVAKARAASYRAVRARTLSGVGHGVTAATAVAQPVDGCNVRLSGTRLRNERTLVRPRYLADEGGVGEINVEMSLRLEPSPDLFLERYR